MVTFTTEGNKEYEEYVKAKLAQDKIKRKAATRKLLKEATKETTNIGPAWYQGLSSKQIRAVDGLGYGLWADIEEGVVEKTRRALNKLGISPRPSEATLFYAMKRCYMNPILFLLYLYKVYGTTPLNTNEKFFCVNDRLILTAMAHIALPRTLAELCLRLPHISPTIKKYPVVCRKLFSKKESPYLEPHSYYMYCMKREERNAIKKRKDYLKKIHMAKEKHDLILPYIHQPEIYSSMRYDGRDEIPQVELEKSQHVKHNINQQRKTLKIPVKTEKPGNQDPSKSTEDKSNEGSFLSYILCESDLELMQHKSMRLPEPIPTEQTIIAMITGYWQTIYGPFRPPSPTPREQELAEKGGATAMMGLAQIALVRMARRGNPLASLQDVHTLPQIKQLVRNLSNYQLTSKQKDSLLRESLRNWDVSLIGTPQIACKPLQFKNTSHLTWAYIHRFKKRNNDHAQTYLNRVSRAMVDDTREFWASMATDYFNIPGFRDIFFTYLPSRIQDIVFKYTD